MGSLAMKMKHRGMYISRQLSLKKATFQVEMLRFLLLRLNECVEFWVRLLESFTSIAALVTLSKKKCATMMAQFWSAHQSFFKYLCTDFKIAHLFKLTNEAIGTKKNSVVIGLQSTGGSCSLKLKGRNLEDFTSSAKDIIKSLVENHFPVRSQKAKFVAKATIIKQRHLEEIELHGYRLPRNPLDHLLTDLGGPAVVSEMTGREGRFVQNDSGQVNNFC